VSADQAIIIEQTIGNWRNPMNRNELDEELNRILKKLKGDDSIKQVLLFGSSPEEIFTKAAISI